MSKLAAAAFTISDTSVAEYYVDPINNKTYTPVNISNGNPGNCLFVAMADQLKELGRKISSKNYHTVLREKAVETQRNWTNIPGVTRKKKAVTNMLRSQTYGNHHEVCALCEYCKVAIRICQVDGSGKLVTWISEGSQFDQIPTGVTDGNTSFAGVSQANDNRPTARLLLVFKSRLSPNNHYMSLREIQ
jgi:hypothetical protein